jgi:succinate dehydrogenase cytochrome b subunit
VSENAESTQTHHFLLRRLHSLTGIVPVGVFLIAHLTTNSTIAWGGLNSRAEGVGWMNRAIATFQHEVSFINNMPLLLIIEVTLWSALAFHAILGVYYAMSGSNNVSNYKYGGNLRYTLQRLTGYFGFLFIFYHVATLRWGWSGLVPGGVVWSHENASSTLAAAIQGSTDGFTGWGLVVALFYFFGVSALVFHFANGLWSSAITWGITISRPAQKRWGLVCAGVGAGLMLMAWASVIGFATLDYQQANEVEEAMQNPQIHLDDADAIETASMNEHEIDG